MTSNATLPVIFDVLFAVTPRASLAENLTAMAVHCFVPDGQHIGARLAPTNTAVLLHARRAREVLEQLVYPDIEAGNYSMFEHRLTLGRDDVFLEPRLSNMDHGTVVAALPSRAGIEEVRK